MTLNVESLWIPKTFCANDYKKTESYVDVFEKKIIYTKIITYDIVDVPAGFWINNYRNTDENVNLIYELFFLKKDATYQALCNHSFVRKISDRLTYMNVGGK